MKPCVVEINDSELRASSGTGTLIASPGLAVLEGGRLLLGEEARRRQRLVPRLVHSRFWSELGQDPLPHATAQARHHADLAYAHLLAVHAQAGKPDEVVFAVPGSLGRDQLALLLGIAQACPFSAVGLVDSALAAAALAGLAPGRHVHVDFQLHAAVLTELVAGAELVRGEVHLVGGAGLAPLYEACARAAADAFVRQCRFDPLAQGDTDQMLYDRLPAWLHGLEQAREVTAVLEHGGGRHQATLQLEPMLEAAAGVYGRIAARMPPADSCLLSHRAARLPRLAARFTVPARHLDPEAVFLGCAAHEGLIRSPGTALTHVTALPAAAPAAPVPDRRGPAAGRTVPTHVLHGHRAYALDGAGLCLGPGGVAHGPATAASGCAVALAEGRAVLRPGAGVPVHVNGELAQGPRALAAGDRIAVGGGAAEFLLITAVGAREA